MFDVRNINSKVISAKFGAQHFESVICLHVHLESELHPRGFLDSLGSSPVTRPRRVDRVEKLAAVNK